MIGSRVDENKKSDRVGLFSLILNFGVSTSLPLVLLLTSVIVNIEAFTSVASVIVFIVCIMNTLRFNPLWIKSRVDIDFIAMAGGMVIFNPIIRLESIYTISAIFYIFLFALMIVSENTGLLVKDASKALKWIGIIDFLKLLLVFIMACFLAYKMLVWLGL